MEVPRNRHKAKVIKSQMMIMVTGTDAIDQDTTATNDEETKLDTEWGITITQQGEMAMLREAVITSQVVAVSNGSFQDQSGSAAWTIEGTTSAYHIVGTGRMPGTTMDQSAYCSKRFGLWGMLRTIWNFIADQQIQTGQIMIACDGLSTL